MIENLNTGYVALLLWAVPAYLTWLWWLHQIDQDQTTQVKWGLVVILLFVGAFWFISWPIVWPRKRPELPDVELVIADAPPPGVR